MLQRHVLNKVLNIGSHLKLSNKSNSSKSVSTLFFEPKVQEIIQKLSTVDLDTIFKVQKAGQRLKPPEYKFMTDKELENELSKARLRAQKLQQMPPVLDARQDDPVIISVDPSLDGHDTDNSKFVFTDITFGITDQDRLIVVREPDGTLRLADWDQRHRMTETYLPRPGREHSAPPMFFGEYLESLLKRKEYEFILDRACAQYEPDDPEYIRVTSSTYTRVAQEKDFRLLFGTRHYGSLLFYLVLNKQIDTLLLEIFKNDRLDDAVSLVHLYYMIHPDAVTAMEPKNDVELIKSFIDKELNRRSVLELSLQTCLERLEEKKQRVNSVEKTHGVEVS